MAVGAAGAGPGAGAGAGAGGATQTVPIALPGGGEREVHFFSDPQVRSHDVPGVLGFQLFPPESARALVEATEAWASSSLAEGFSESPDSVDDKPEWQLDVFMGYTVTDGYATEGTSESPELRWDSEAEPMNPNYEAVRAVLPLAKSLCLDILPPFLAKYRVASDTCNQVFLRKYKAGSGRSKLGGHQDSSIFTLNVALSDYREVEGGELFMCRQLPQVLAWAMQLELCNFGESRDLGQGGSHCQQFMQPYARIASKERGAEACMKAQGYPGEAVSTFGSRLHGVFPTTGGTRYSLILFIGRATDSDALDVGDGPETSEDGSETSGDGPAVGLDTRAWLNEPFGDSHVAELPREDLLIWLTISSGFSTLAARGDISIHSTSIYAFHTHLVPNTTSGQRKMSDRFNIEDLVLAVKFFWEDADVVALALRSIHALLTREIKGLPAQRPIVLARCADTAVEFTRKAVSAHSERFDVGRLGCTVLENLLCGPDSSEECAERAPECEEDPDLVVPLDIDPEVHGIQGAYDLRNNYGLYSECVEEAKTLEGPDASGKALSPDCFLFVPLNYMYSTTTFLGGAKAEPPQKGAPDAGGEL